MLCKQQLLRSTFVSVFFNFVMKWSALLHSVVEKSWFDGVDEFQRKGPVCGSEKMLVELELLYTNRSLRVFSKSVNPSPSFSLMDESHRFPLIASTWWGASYQGHSIKVLSDMFVKSNWKQGYCTISNAVYTQPTTACLKLQLDVYLDWELSTAPSTIESFATKKPPSELQ